MVDPTEQVSWVSSFVPSCPLWCYSRRAIIFFFVKGKKATVGAAQMRAGALSMGGLHRWAQTRFLPHPVPGHCCGFCHHARTAPILSGPTGSGRVVAWLGQLPALHLLPYWAQSYLNHMLCCRSMARAWLEQGGHSRFLGPWWGEEGSWLCVPVWAGAHLEGPFISKEKKGAHPEHCLRNFEAGAFQDLLATYGSLDCVRIVTLAPEMKRSSEVIRELNKRGICVSLGKGWAEEA